ncbi:MAG: hypothetical protein LBC65_01255 [Oscillospiraceae bacterium]|nr:hypothetical protein [Oscillospiraceae bacterium]
MLCGVLIASALASVYRLYVTRISPRFVSTATIWITATDRNGGAGVSASALLEQMGIFAGKAEMFIPFVENRDLRILVNERLGLEPNDYNAFEMTVQSISSSAFIKVSINSPNAGLSFDACKAVLEILPDSIARINFNASIITIDAPAEAEIPERPAMSLLLMTAIAGGLALGFVLVMLNEIASSSVRSAADVTRAIGVKTIAALPAMSTHSARFGSRLQASYNQTRYDLSSRILSDDATLYVVLSIDHSYPYLQGIMRIKKAICGGGEFSIGYWANDSIDLFVKRRVTESGTIEPRLDNEGIDKLLGASAKSYRKILLPVPFMANQLHILEMLERDDVKIIYLVQHNKTRMKELTVMSDRLSAYRDKVLGCVMCGVSTTGPYSYYKSLNPFY